MKLEHTVFTKNQAIQLMDALERIKAALHTSRSWVDIAAELLSLEQKQILETTLTGSDPQELASAIDHLLVTLAKMPTVGLTLAYTPSEASLTKWSDWFEHELGHKVVFEISYNPQIMGSATVSFNGRYKDYSLSKNVDEILKSL